MKKTIIIILLFSAFIIASCSKSDDAKPATLENASISLTTDNTVIAAPAAMTKSSDPQAQMATAWIGSVNSISSYFSYMKAPSGATKSSTRIVASNARVAASGDVLVYEWKDASSNSIAYQVSETDDSFVFEIFIKFKDEANYLKYYVAEEKKDKSAGSMTILNIFDGDGTTEIIKYTWSRSNDILNFTMTSSEEQFVVNISINEKTGAGSVLYTLEGVKLYDMVWDASGNGTWTSYDENGVVGDTGSWKVS